MKPLRVSRDVVPIGQFKGQAASWFRHLEESGEPVLITQNGKPAAVLLAPAEYDRLAERARFVESVLLGLADVEAGRTMDTATLRARLKGQRTPSSPILVNVVWTEQALQRLAEVHASIAQDDWDAADRLVERIIDAAEALESFPEQGRVVPEFGQRSEVVRKSQEGIAPASCRPARTEVRGDLEVVEGRGRSGAARGQARPPRFSVNLSLRELIEGRCRIVYRVGERVQVLTVFEGHRQLPADDV